jgi:RNA polymerase sigma factor FliA
VGVDSSFDEVLPLDWVSRLTFDELLVIFQVPAGTGRRAMEIERAMERIEARYGRDATDEELAAELKIPSDELLASINELGRAKTDTLARMWNSTDWVNELDADDLEESRHDAPARGYRPWLRIPESEGKVRARIAVAIVASPESDRLLIALYHYAHLTPREIGRVAGVDESEVPSRYATAVLRLRSKVPQVAFRV